MKETITNSPDVTPTPAADRKIIMYVPDWSIYRDKKMIGYENYKETTSI